LLLSSKSEREIDRERGEAHHLCTLFKENQNFTEKIPSPLFLQATNYSSNYKYKCHSFPLSSDAGAVNNFSIASS
jgi:hypothetical protein